MVKGNLAEKRGSSGNRAGGGAIVGKGGGVQGSKPCALAGVGYGRRGVGTGAGGILVFGSSGRRKSELKKVLGSKGPGQLFRAWVRGRGRQDDVQRAGEEPACTHQKASVLAMYWTGY